MQKLIAILMLSLYVLVSIGVQGVSHFCGDEFVGIAWFEDKEEVECGEMACCSLPEPTDEDKCCTDVQFTVFFESERSLAFTSENFVLNPPAEPVLPYSALILDDNSEISLPSDQYLDPGVFPSTPIYLQNQSLIFYG